MLTTHNFFQGPRPGVEAAAAAVTPRSAISPVAAAHVRFLSGNGVGPRMGMGHYERLLLRALLHSGAAGDGWRFDIRYAGRAPRGGAGEGGPEPGLAGADFEGYSPARLARLPWAAARAAVTLSQRRPPPDLYHALTLDYPVPFGRPAVYTVHDLPPARFRDEGTLPRWARRAAGAARAVLTPSEFSRRELVELLGLPGDKVHVVPNGYEGEVFHPGVAPADAAARAALGLPGPYLLYVGGGTRRKNVRSLLDAWTLLAPQYPDLTLALAGPAGALAALAAASDAPRVVTVGYLGRGTLPGVLRAATALVCPSIYEGFGLPPLEAMALGVPVIGVRAGAVPEVTGGCAVLAPDGSADSLARAVRTLLDDAALAAGLRRGGPERARHFSWAEHALQTLAIYREVMDS